MRLSEINKKELSDDEIQKIVYADVFDTGGIADYALVFGNSNLIKERVSTAFRIYQEGRVKKLIFSGGTNGISNEEASIIPEALRMKDEALKMGVKETDIIVETKSNNTFENVFNVLELIPDVTKLVIITSEFHLKRCYAIIKKYKPSMEVIMVPSFDGESDSENWYLSDNSWNSGRSLATFEANVLIKYAKEDKIVDLDIPNI